MERPWRRDEEEVREEEHLLKRQTTTFGDASCLCCKQYATDPTIVKVLTQRLNESKPGQPGQGPRQGQTVYSRYEFVTPGAKCAGETQSTSLGFIALPKFRVVRNIYLFPRTWSNTPHVRSHPCPTRIANIHTHSSSKKRHGINTQPSHPPSPPDLNGSPLRSYVQC